jgi:uncharacterized protein
MVGENVGTFGPTRGSERLVLLDALRGFALFGVLLANLRDLSLYGFLPEETRAGLATAGIDRWLDLTMTALVDGKSFTIFTLLFGIGFAMQAERARAAGNGMSRYVRRLLVLLFIGLLHAYLLWWGDILRLYAVLGLFLLPVARWRPWMLALLGVVIAVFVTPFIRQPMGLLLPQIGSAQSAAATALAAFQGPNYVAMLRANLAYDVWTRIAAWGLPFYVLGRLLLGAAIGRGRRLQDSEAHRRFWRRLFCLLLPLGIALTAFCICRDQGVFGPLRGWWRSEPAHAIVRLARSGGSLALGLAYVALFVLLFRIPAWRRWLQAFAPVGQMALTNYLLQTGIAIGIFYGVGFGFGPRFGMVAVVLIAAALFRAQIVLSRWWLERFHFGPLEWIWRSATYARLQPMRRS